MNRTTEIRARVEPRTKTRAEVILRRLGLSPGDAIRLFYHQICLRRGLPFPVHVPNELTRRTLDKSRRGEGVEAFDSPEELFASWER
ncbi:MAG: type II toxin-antitoxin system RelB/DinJ family antitoxin [Deltaproteobacteria bacterium]|nr:type II toxin-antitoxin system RelB/DinJ family antitoxin [Deltaproteobacteria bacterium]